VLKKLAEGISLKQVPLPKSRKPTGVSAKLSQFSWKFYQFCVLCGTNSPAESQAGPVCGIIRERSGISFPHQRIAAQDVVRGGETKQLDSQEQVREPRSGTISASFDLPTNELYAKNQFARCRLTLTIATPHYRAQRYKIKDDPITVGSSPGGPTRILGCCWFISVAQQKHRTDDSRPRQGLACFPSRL
jgi:hypothetical protein